MLDHLHCDNAGGNTAGYTGAYVARLVYAVLNLVGVRARRHSLSVEMTRALGACAPPNRWAGVMMWGQPRTGRRGGVGGWGGGRLPPMAPFGARCRALRPTRTARDGQVPRPAPWFTLFMLRVLLHEILGV